VVFVSLKVKDGFTTALIRYSLDRHMVAVRRVGSKISPMTNPETDKGKGSPISAPNGWFQAIF
jgi:hypothetical protein